MGLTESRQSFIEHVLNTHKKNEYQKDLPAITSTPSSLHFENLPICVHPTEGKSCPETKSHTFSQEIKLVNNSQRSQEFQIIVPSDGRYDIQVSATKGLLKKSEVIRLMVSIRAHCTLSLVIPLQIVYKRKNAKTTCQLSIDVKISSQESEYLDYRDLHFEKTIFSGNHADLKKATYRGTPVAVKVYQGAPTSYWDRVLFDRERKFLMQAQGEFSVKYIGVCIASGFPTCLIMEWIPHGTLHQFLVHKNRVLSEATKRHLAINLVKAIKEMHSTNVFHRDLKASNIMLQNVNSDFSSIDLRIVDFGAASTEQERLHLSDSYDAPGTVTHQAPEGFISTNYQLEKADVYSVGILIWQIFMQQVPFYGVNDQEVKNQTLAGKRPPFNKHLIPKDIRSVIRQCWHKDPNKRPALEEVLRSLTDTN